MKHNRPPTHRPLSRLRHLVLSTLLTAVLALLLLAPTALAAPAVDGWRTTSLSKNVGEVIHARMDEGRVVWADGLPSGVNPIVLEDVANGQRRVIAADGSSPEIDGDHIVYFGPTASAASDGGGVFLYTISTGETTRLTSDAQTSFTYGLSVEGDMVAWVSAARMGPEGALTGNYSLVLYDIAKNRTVSLAARQPGSGGFVGDYVADAHSVVWTAVPSSEVGVREVWVYSAVTGETREIPSLRNYNLVAVAGDKLVAYRQWGSEGGVQHYVSYDLQTEQLRPLDMVPEGSFPGSLAVDGGSIAWAGYDDGSSYVALSDLATGQTTRILTTGYDVGGLVLCGDLLLFHGQFPGRVVGGNFNYLLVYDRARDLVTRVATLAGHNGSYGTDGTYVAFSTGDLWPYGWDDPQELILAGPTNPSVAPFLDVPGTHLYRTAIQGLKERGIVAGYTSSAGAEFHPDATLTRAQFAKMLALALGIAVNASDVAPFDDVPVGLFPGAYVAALSELGIVQGTSPRMFSPDATLTRAQLMTLLVRGADKVKPGVIGMPPMTNYPSNYPQGYSGALGAFDPTHAPFMLRAELNGLVDGLVGYGFGGAWDPWRTATRAEAAQALWNFLGKEGRLARGVSFAPTVAYLEPTSGPVAGGNAVVIAGNHLTGATALTFGGTNATSFHVDDQNQITAVAPAHAAGTVDVQVTTPAGSSGTAGAADNYTYTTAPPTVTLLSPNSGTTAGGTQDSAVIIKGTALIGTTAVMFGTTAATSFWVTSSDEMYAVAPAHAAGLVDVRVTTPNGTSVPTAASTYEYVDVFPSPPLDTPVDLVRRTAAPWVWGAVVADHTVAYVESDSFGFASLSQPDTTQTAVITTLDLATGKVSAVPGGGLSSPTWGNAFFWPWWFLAELPNAKGDGTGPSLVWAVGNPQYAGFRWQGFTGWNASVGTKAVLSPETMTLPPIRTGDILALPRTTPAYENAHGGMVGTTLGDTLLLLTPSLDQPIAVDPAAPVLPAAALVGISPYVSWSGWLLGQEPPTQYAAQFRSDLPGKPPRVFDLRSGELVDIAVKDPRAPEDWFASVVAGHWAAWVAIESSPKGSSLYLADLSTGQAERLADAPTGEVALSNDWLLWTDPSGNLLGYHLPDLTPVRVAGVLTSSEAVRSIQISGDLAVLMVVAQESNEIGPDLPPRWTAIRVVRLR